MHVTPEILVKDIKPWADEMSARMRRMEENHKHWASISDRCVEDVLLLKRRLSRLDQAQQPHPKPAGDGLRAEDI